MSSLRGQRAMITGGAAGIGRAAATALAHAGADIAIFDVNFREAESVCEELLGFGVRTTAIRGSVAEPEDVRIAFTRMDELIGPASILINNAGIGGNKPTLDLSTEEWKTNIGINLDGVFYCCREAGLRMKEAGGGAIVNLGSIYSLVAPPNRLHYCAPKAAVEMMTRALAVEWAQYGIRVNGVAPGYVQTHLLEQLVDQGRVDLSAIKKRTPLGRLGTVDEIADAILYLCENRSAYITGHMLPVDGGWTSYGYV